MSLFQITRVVTIIHSDAASSLQFHYPADFWEINRVISRAKCLDAVDQLVIDALVEDAISNIPRGLGSSVAAGVQVATEDLDESEGTLEVEGFASVVEEAELTDVSDADDVEPKEVGTGTQ